MFIFEGWWEAGPGKTTASTIQTALHLPRFETAVRDRAEYDGGEKNPNQITSVINNFEGRVENIKKYEASRNCNVAGKGESRRGDTYRKVQGPAVASTSKSTAKVLVEGCWHCQGSHLEILCRQLRGGKEQEGGARLGPNGGVGRGGCGESMLYKKSTLLAVFSHSLLVG